MSNMIEKYENDQKTEELFPEFCTVVSVPLDEYVSLKVKEEKIETLLDALVAHSELNWNDSDLSATDGFYTVLAALFPDEYYLHLHALQAKAEAEKKKKEGGGE